MGESVSGPVSTLSEPEAVIRPVCLPPEEAGAFAPGHADGIELRRTLC